eukprot:CAMPEP_0197456280 /NCGR_PEP_ID=MMETSP1175-20131217/42945_1 /TAXON_ID=1003142 /ORGANISM="Triceratium dubium, Strain CCMP147" /LENGTH=56 /DNA_ID=CAMNT_0042990325 /DNA_START=29 /DNA_END=199 /DNA_ORIENTATION=-
MNHLGALDFEAVEVEADAAAPPDALASWFALVPEEDVKAVERLFRDVKSLRFRASS